MCFRPARICFVQTFFNNLLECPHIPRTRWGSGQLRFPNLDYDGEKCRRLYVNVNMKYQGRTREVVSSIYVSATLRLILLFSSDRSYAVRSNSPRSLGKNFSRHSRSRSACSGIAPTSSPSPLCRSCLSGQRCLPRKCS